MGFDAGPLTIDIYGGSQYTGGTGTEWPGADRNFVDAVTPKFKVVYKPTVTIDGTKLPPEFFVPSNGTPASIRLAGETTEQLPINLTKGSATDVYMLRITNTTASAGIGEIGISWFEF